MVEIFATKVCARKLINFFFQEKLFRRRKPAQKKIKENQRDQLGRVSVVYEQCKLPLRENSKTKLPADQDKHRKSRGKKRN